MTTKKLTRRQRILVATTLFGMFFGAGNLIFPVHLGQMAGSNVIPAIIGFIITAVGIPIFGVAAIGVTHSDGLQTLSGKVGRGYGIFFTCLLYLTIGPLFHPQMRDCLVHDRRFPDALGSGTTAGAAAVLSCLLRIRAVLLAASGQNHGLDWQDHQSCLSVVPGRARDRRTAESRRIHFGRCTN